MQPSQSLSEDELARGSGAPPEQIRRLVDLGIVPRRDGERPFEAADVHRIRLAQAFERSGIALEAIGDAIGADWLSLDFVERMFPLAAPLSGRTFAEVADDMGVPLETLTRLYAMWGLPRPVPEDAIREDDEPTFREWKAFFPPEALNDELLTQGARLFGEATSRVADWGMSMYRTYMEAPMRAAGMTSQEMLDAATAFASVGTPIMERQLGWLLRRKLEHNAFQLIVEHIEGAIEAAGTPVPGTARPSAIAFVDLSGYTALTEEIGDQAAADRAATLGTMLQELAHARGGRVVKLLGDGAMLHFPDPAEAVRTGLEVVRHLNDAGMPPAHVGVAAGPVVFREGDYYGRVVNLAARIMGRAGANEVLAAAGVASALEDLAFESLGMVELKGIAEPVELFRATAAGDAPTAH